jgi:hypothetical protein
MLDEQPCPACGTYGHAFCTFDEDAIPPTFEIGTRVGVRAWPNTTGRVVEFDGAEGFYKLELEGTGGILMGLGPYDIFRKRSQKTPETR